MTVRSAAGTGLQYVGEAAAHQGPTKVGTRRACAAWLLLPVTCRLVRQEPRGDPEWRTLTWASGSLTVLFPTPHWATT